MKRMLSMTAMIFMAVAGSASAESSAHKAWGTSYGGSNGSAKIVDHGNLGVIAGQNEDAKKGLLSGAIKTNTYYNSSCNNCSSVDITGDGNDVSVGQDNTGNSGAQQAIGDGPIKQGLQN